MIEHGVVRRASVRVPATTANLGAGFDCVGVALDRWLHATVELRAAGSDDVRITRRGTLATLDTALGVDPHVDLLYRGFTTALEAAETRFHGTVTFDAISDIPVARGLGSSAAALLAGAALANIVLDLRLTLPELVHLCAHVEGQADNIAPAALGGAVLVVPSTAGAAHYTRLDVHSSLAFAFAVPDFEIRTALARAVLPTQVPHAVAAAGAARAAALIHGLYTGDGTSLASALDDQLHVPYRRALVPHFDRVLDAARAAGAFGATLSGSGSSMVAIAPRARAAGAAAAMVDAWRASGIQGEGFATQAGDAGLAVELSSQGSMICP